MKRADFQALSLENLIWGGLGGAQTPELLSCVGDFEVGSLQTPL